MSKTQTEIDHKRVEEELRQSNEKFSKIFKISPDSITISRLSDGTFLEVNQSFTDITGYASEEVLGRTSLPGDVAMWTCEAERDRMVAELKAHGEVIGLEMPLRMKNGEIRTTLLSARTLEINSENCILIIARDITERKREEEQVRQAKEVLEMIFKNSPDAGVITRLRDGLIVDINDRFETVSGYSRSEVLGKTSIELHLYEKSETRDKIVMELVKNGHFTDMEPVFRTKSGANIIGIMSSQIIQLNGEPHVYSIIHDITERKKTETLLMNAQKLDSLGILAGGIAHDFNNLLTGVYGFVDLARDGCKDQQTAEYLTATHATLDRARALTMQLLTFAKGGAPVQKTMPLTPVIKETVKFALSGSNVSCTFRLANDLWPCYIDKNQIGQVIDNIVINAQQAMPGGGTITISAVNTSLAENDHSLLAAGKYVKVSIADPGTGIPIDIMPRIFDPFYSTKTKGHGLGLATSYSIVSRHGGCIDVESEQGKGSTFHVYLPASTIAAGTAQDTAIMHKGSGTILVVDDEEIVRETVHKMLEMMGYNVVCQKDGKAAIDLYTQETVADHRFSAMMFDLTIPGGMGGKEAVGRIRQLSKDIPIFVMSGYADDPVLKDPVAYGFTASISKPFTIAELSEMLQKHMRR